MYPAGDLSATLAATARNLRMTPNLHFDYCFDPGAQVNLYLRRGNAWYEFLLTGKEAQDTTVYTAGRIKAVADGQWHHLEADLGKMLADAIAKQTGTADGVELTIQEMIVADWSAAPDARFYGFGNNFGGVILRFDNIVFVPTLTSPLTITLQLPGSTAAAWKTSLDTAPVGVPTTETTGATLTLKPEPGRQFFHLRWKDKDGKWSPVLTIPLVTVAASTP